MTMIDKTKEVQLLKDSNLPTSKPLVYFQKLPDSTWEKHTVLSVEEATTYLPSGFKSLKLKLENGKETRVLAPYLVHMQKSSFISDIEAIINTPPTIKVSKKEKSANLFARKGGE